MFYQFTVKLISIIKIIWIIHNSISTKHCYNIFMNTHCIHTSIQNNLFYKTYFY